MIVPLSFDPAVRSETEVPHMKKLISLLFVIVLLAGIAVFPVSASAAPTFSDVPADFWAYDAIEEMAEKGIVSGMGNGKFEPNGSVTTAQFATMLVGAFFPEELCGDTRTYPAWYGKTMHIALEEGLLATLPARYTCTITESGETWDPVYVNNRMTRKEMAVMLTNFLKNHLDFGKYGFQKTDFLDGPYDLPDYRYCIEYYPANYPDAISFVYDLGIITGVDDAGTFSGDGLMTRAQACLVLKRTMDLIGLYGGNAEDNREYHIYEFLDWNEKNDHAVSPDIRLTNGETITPEHVRELIDSLREKYPEGMPSADENYEYGENKDGIYLGYTGCAALVNYMRDDIFGDNRNYVVGYYDHAYDPAYLGEYAYQLIRPGDHIRINETHSVLVLDKTDSYITVVEGNYNGKVHWGRKISKSALLNSEIGVFSCYPSLPVK